jgi:hypothetical protein
MLVRLVLDRISEPARWREEKIGGNGVWLFLPGNFILAGRNSNRVEVIDRL